MSLRRACLAVGLLTFAVALVAVPARATTGARTTADEPQYLLTARSLVDDRDLDIGDELAARAYEPFHEITIDTQTRTDDDGSGHRISPHDPLLPVLLVPGTAIGGWLGAGWVGAKVSLAALAGLTASLTCWLAHRRFGVTLASAAVAAAGFGVSAPLVGYATQVYPEVPAALAVLTILAGATERDPTRRGLALIVVGCVALPWLSVKYVPVAVVATGVALWHRRRRSDLVVAGAVLSVAAVAYLVVHQRLYGGWTVYAAGDHFVATGEFSVMGTSPNLVGRSRRLVALLVDRRFGLIPWAPVWALVPAACAAVRRGHRLLLLGPFAAGWATATWVALTMHGWWSPGRQVVVVAPVAAIAVAGLLDGLPRLRWVAIGSAVAGAVNWVWLSVEAATGRRTLIVDFFETAAWPYRAVEWAFAPGWPVGSTNDPLLALWTVVLAGTVVAARASRSAPPVRDPHDATRDPGGTVQAGGNGPNDDVTLTIGDLSSR